MDELQGAVYDTVHEFRNGMKRGAPALAPLVGMRVGTLLNKSNPEQEAELTLVESIPLQLLAKDFRILYAYATKLNHTPPIPFPDFSNTSDMELLSAYARYHAEIGKLAETLNDALEDGRIERKEFERIRRVGLEAQQRFHELLARVEALVDE